MNGKWETGDQQFLFPEELCVPDIKTDVDLVKHLLTEPYRSMNGSLTSVALHNLLIDSGKCRKVIKALKDHIVALEQYVDTRDDSDTGLIQDFVRDEDNDLRISNDQYIKWVASLKKRPHLKNLQRSWQVTFTPEEIAKSGEAVTSEAAIPQTDLVGKQMGEASDVVQGC